MKVIVAGSRDLVYVRNARSVADALNRFEEAYGPVTRVISGGCRGADHIGSLLAEEHSIPWDLYKADWDIHGKATGPRRNQRMVDFADGLVVVRYRDSRGSADVLARAQAKGIPVVDVVLERPA